MYYGKTLPKPPLNSSFVLKIRHGINRVHNRDTISIDLR